MANQYTSPKPQPALDPDTIDPRIRPISELGPGCVVLLLRCHGYEIHRMSIGQRWDERDERLFGHPFSYWKWSAGPTHFMELPRSIRKRTFAEALREAHETTWTNAELAAAKKMIEGLK